MEIEEEMDIVLKVEVEEDTFDETEKEPEQKNESGNSVNKIEEYKKALEKKSEEKEKNIQDELILAFDIMQACREGAPPGLTPIEELHHYTMVPIPELIEAIKDKDIAVDKSFKSVLESTAKLPSSVLTFIYNDIRDIFIEYYVRKRQMPSVTDLMENLRKNRDVVFYKSADITTLVKNKLVKYNFLPKLNSYILTENPEFSYQRHLYLRRVMQNRATKSFVYVAVLMVPTNTGNTAYSLLAVTSKNGLIAKSDDFIPYAPTDEENGHDAVKLWMRRELTRKISTNSVVILMQPKKADRTPTPHSSKAEMIEWLSNHNMPHDADSHKSYLYNLIKLTKKNFKLGFYEEVLASAGFEVIICPIEYPSLDFFNKIQTHAIESKASIEMFVTMISQEEWRLMEKELIEEEKRMLKDDQEMDKIIENLFQMVKNGDLNEEDFPEGCRATKADNFAVHIGDIICD